MSDVQGVSSRRHFSPEEEDALRRNDSTSSIVRRDTKLAVDIDTSHLAWPEVKHHQQSLGDNKLGMLEPAAKIFEGAAMTGLLAKLEHAVAATRIAHAVEIGIVVAEIAAPVGAFILGVHELLEAHKKGEEQSEALAKDAAHVALIGVLDLPASYKNERMNVTYKHVPFEFGTPAFRAAEGLWKDKKDLATLQLRADRGMCAARDVLASGMTSTAFMKQNPRVLESIITDPAFREGFEGYLHGQASMPEAEMTKVNAALNERDGWYAQSEIRIRM